MLRGTIRDHDTRSAGPFVRFFACERGSLPRTAGRSAARRRRGGAEPLLIVGAMAGG